MRRRPVEERPRASPLPSFQRPVLNDACLRVGVPPNNGTPVTLRDHCCRYDLDIFNIVAVADFNVGRQALIPAPPALPPHRLPPCRAYAPACVGREGGGRACHIWCAWAEKAVVGLAACPVRCPLSPTRPSSLLLGQMGAMENKSLNIFNSKFILALPTTATDAMMRRVEGIIAVGPAARIPHWPGSRHPLRCLARHRRTARALSAVWPDIAHRPVCALAV